MFTHVKSLLCAMALCLAVSGTTFAQTPVIDSLKRIIEAGKNDLETSKSLNVLATEYTRTDLGKAKITLYTSIKLAKELKNPVTLSYAYAQMVAVQSNTGRTDSAQWYLQTLKELASGDVPENVKGSYYQAAGLFYKRQGNYKDALPVMVQSLKQFIASDQKKPSPGLKTSIAGQYLNIGNTEMDLGDYKSALNYHLKGLQLFEELGNQRGISFCYQSICSDFIHLKQFTKAETYLKKSLALKQELGDKRGVALAMAEYSTIYTGLHNNDKAVAALHQAIQSFRELKLVPDEARADVEMGKLMAQGNDPTQAIEYFRLAKLLAAQAKDSAILVSADAEEAALSQKTASQKKTEEKLLTNLGTAIHSGDKTKELSSYETLADYYSKQKQFDKALDYTKKLYSGNDSISNADLQLQIRKMEQQYNLERKENEIAILKRDQLLNEEKLRSERNFKYGLFTFLGMLVLVGALLINRYRVVQQAKRAMEMERMRSKIAQDLHDDIGSTLSSINILSKTVLQQHTGNGQVQTAMSKIKDYSGHIMGNMSDIVWAINPSNDTLGKIVVRLKTYAAEVLEPQNIRYEINDSGSLEQVEIDLNHRKDLYLICKEVINNVAKYSACSRMTMSIASTANEITIEIKDDGKGFDPNTIRSGNGLANIRSRAAAMKAGIRIDAAPGKGTSVSMKIPLT